MDTQCSSKRKMSSYKEERIWLCKWSLEIVNKPFLKILTDFKLRFSNKELSECETLCRDDTGSLGFQCRSTVVQSRRFLVSLHLQSCLLFWADLLEYKRTSYMAAALFIVSQMQVTMIICCRHFNSSAAQGQQVQHLSLKLISTGASVTTRGSKSASSVRTTAILFPKALLPPLSTASIRWSISCHHNTKSWQINEQVCIEGAQPEGLEGKSGADGPELSYLYGREDRCLNSFCPYNIGRYLMTWQRDST